MYKQEEAKIKEPISLHEKLVLLFAGSAMGALFIKIMFF